MDTSLNVLIPDGNSTWALTVMNCLSQIGDYNLFVLSNKKRAATKYSRSTAYYKHYKRISDAQWLEVITKEVKAKIISVIVPIAEEEIRFFIQNEHLLPPSVKVMPLPNLENFSTAIDKCKLSHFLKVYNLPHPRFVVVDSFQSLNAELSTLQFPILIKPIGNKGGDGILRFDDSTKLDSYVAKLSSPNEFIIQEYIDGYDIDCSVLCLNGKVLTYTIQKGNLQGDNPYAPQLGFHFLENDAVLKVVEQLMLKLKWSGVAHIDLRHDNKTNDYKVIEINARFWGSIEGSMVAGINFPDLVIQLALGKQISHSSYRKMHYMRLKGVLKSIKRRPALIFKGRYLMNNTEAKSFLKDPIPTFYRFWEWLKRKF